MVYAVLVVDAVYNNNILYVEAYHRSNSIFCLILLLSVWNLASYMPLDADSILSTVPAGYHNNMSNIMSTI